ncbi:MAG: AI-2E family transporter [Bacteroidetes bacterium]|nr:AI-2E family transporter [Bacteroidota bacterium]
MNISQNNIISFIILLVCIAATLVFPSIVLYLFIAFLMSIIGRPIKQFVLKINFKKNILPESVASLIALLVLLIFFFGTFTLFIPLVVNEIKLISSLSVTDITERLGEPIKRIEYFAQNLNIKELEKTSVQEFVTIKIRELLSFSWITDTLNNIVSTIGNFFVAIFTISFMTFYFLNEENLINIFFKTVFPKTYHGQIDSVIVHAKKLLTRYLIGIIIENLATGILLFIALSIFGIDNALLLAFIGGLLNIVPYIGPVFSSAIACVIALTTNTYLDFYTEWYILIIKVAGIFAVVQFIDNMFLQPYIFSNSVKAHPLEIFIVLIAAGNLFGITGMILAVPVYSILKIISMEIYSSLKKN